MASTSHSSRTQGRTRNVHTFRKRTLHVLATLLASVAAMLVSATPDAHAAPQQILAFYESDDNVGPDHMPLTPVDGTTTNSETFVVRQLGPIVMEPGDCLDVSSREQFRNRNAANGWWTVGGVRSEHWWLWVSGYASLRFTTNGPPLNAYSGMTLIPETGQGWDGAMHRWQWETNEVACTPQRIPALYVFTTVRFASSSGWRQSDDQYIINDQIGALEAIHMGVR